MLKHYDINGQQSHTDPAAFRRLCVETFFTVQTTENEPFQPPSGGCVLKPCITVDDVLHGFQPPSGGCVLKLTKQSVHRLKAHPAAFRGLCVETNRDFVQNRQVRHQPPSGGCVLKQPVSKEIKATEKPAAFRRLCVETFGAWCNARFL